MAMTDKKRRFAAALKSGASKKDAAISAGYSDKTASAAGSRLAKDPDVIAELARKEHVEQAKAEAKAQGKEFNLPDLSKMYSDPLDFLKAVMNDAGEDLRYRVDAAKAMMPFVHAKKGEGGKKEQQAEAARKVSGKFASAAPPKLLAINGKRQ